ncbi:alpha/beta fold hydrolase [Nakamurella sp.]|uniref:alpha/beta fold hydrolase n=1 Tax=Nakamurella sp. TaxID=1869182 RepID=UPI003784B411
MTEALDLGDGRELGYRCYGAPDGLVVVNCHGGLVCGLDAAPFDTVARDLGIRIVSPDRPGLGASGAAPGRTTGDWAGDVQALLDVLGADTASVLGWSMGGQYALACAALLPDRIRSTAVVAGCRPLDDDSTFRELNTMDRRLTLLARHHPHVAATTFRALGGIARHTPAAWAHLTLRAAQPDEASTLEALPDPGIAAAAAAALDGGDGMVEEYRAWVRPWGFAPADIPGPVTFWHGDADDLVPPAWSAALAAAVPHGRLERVPGAGHFLGYTHTADILRGLTG